MTQYSGETIAREELPVFWFVKLDPDMYFRYTGALVEDASLGIINTSDLLDFEYDLRDATGDIDSLWPASYPLPVAALPQWFAPDYWSFGTYEFASRRLRDALAQPGDVVQFLPIDLVRASAEAQAQDYSWMRVLGRQEALDLARCECKVEHPVSYATGQPYLRLWDIQVLALRHDLQPRAEVFRLEESPTFVLVTEAVADRVQRAGCTGIEFSDPVNRLGGMRVERFRTPDGIAERRIGYLD